MSLVATVRKETTILAAPIDDAVSRPSRTYKYSTPPSRGESNSSSASRHSSSPRQHRSSRTEPFGKPAASKQARVQVMEASVPPGTERNELEPTVTLTATHTASNMRLPRRIGPRTNDRPCSSILHDSPPCSISSANLSLVREHNVHKICPFGKCLCGRSASTIIPRVSAPGSGQVPPTLGQGARQAVAAHATHWLVVCVRRSPPGEAAAGMARRGNVLSVRGFGGVESQAPWSPTRHNTSRVS